MRKRELRSKAKVLPGSERDCSSILCARLPTDAEVLRFSRNTRTDDINVEATPLQSFDYFILSEKRNVFLRRL